MSKYGRGECQVCAKTFALDKSGRLVNHGFTRPGCGWLVGGCWGVGYLPYPMATDAIEIAIRGGKEAYKRTEERVASLANRTNETVWYKEYRRAETRYEKSGYYPVEVSRNAVPVLFASPYDNTDTRFGTVAFEEHNAKVEAEWLEQPSYDEETETRAEWLERLKSEWFETHTGYNLEVETRNLKEIDSTVKFWEARKEAASK